VTADNTRLKKFVASVRWIFAKTCANTAPHEYIIYDKLDAEDKLEYEWFVEQIKQSGVDGKFYKATFRYLHLDDMKYWTCDAETKKTAYSIEL
jgi:hypothetical protein